MTETFQDLAHSSDWDYEAGSPHLKHAHLHQWMLGTIRTVVQQHLSINEDVHVLEVGAGHGTFTDQLLSAGARVTLTEMSRASAEKLTDRYRYNDRANVVFDPEGEGSEIAGERFDLVLCVAVLHHIPDYIAAIERWVAQIRPGGALMSFQDPLWYPRQPKFVRIAERGSYYVWRLSRGDLKEGLRSALRRRRGVFDEANPRDMVEYHVLRQGCDELLIADRLQQHFAEVEVVRYWSTQARRLQSLGERAGLLSEFGVVARQRVE